jgi:LL-diaminopimelate aminotransferase
VGALISHYMGNAAILREACVSIGLDVFGGTNAPYIWVNTPPGISSWDMFDLMLEDANIVVTPGAGFGSNGEGFFRISAFNSRENAQEAAKRIMGMNF